MGELVRDLFIDSEHEAIKASDDELVVEGFLATYDLDKQNERWVPGSWGDAIKNFMANPSRPVLYEHRRELGQFGTVEHLEERPGGLWGRLRLPKPAGPGVLSQAWQAVKAGITKGVSIHAPMLMSRQSDGTALLLPRSIKEASITPFPINETSVVGVATKAFADKELSSEDQAALDEFRAELQGRFDAAEATIADAEKSQRDEWAKKGIAMKDGSFPITHCGTDSYSNGAARSRAHQGDASDSAIMAHIRKREKALGCKSGGAGD